MPKGLGAKITEDKRGVLITWDKPKAADLKGILIYRATEENGPFYPISPLIVESSFVDTRVREGKVYYYRLCAIDRSNNRSPLSKPIKVRFKE